VPCWSTAAALAGAALPQPPGHPWCLRTRPGLVPVPVWFLGYLPMASTTEAPPLAAVLVRFHSTTLAPMISMLLMVCHPLLRQHECQICAPPLWWPMALEPWWAAEVEAHLSQVPTPVPFFCCKMLKKVHQMAVLVAIVKHLSPDFVWLAHTMRHCRLSPSNAALWDSMLRSDRAYALPEASVHRADAAVAARPS
jgi:hypothetical protein